MTERIEHGRCSNNNERRTNQGRHGRIAIFITD